MKVGETCFLLLVELTSNQTNNLQPGHLDDDDDKQNQQSQWRSVARHVAGAIATDLPLAQQDRDMLEGDFFMTWFSL